MSLPTPRLLVLCSCMLALAALPLPAQATVARDLSAGGACHAANGAAVGKFTFSNFSLLNIGTTDQFVVCNFQMEEDLSLTLKAASTLSVSVTAGATPGTVTCTAQTGHHYSGATVIRSSFVRTVTLPASNNGYLLWDDPAWIRINPWDTLTLNCRLPGGFRMGLIEWYQ